MKKLLILLPLTILLGISCTKIDEKVYDQYDAKKFYATPEGISAALAGVYAQIPGNWGGVGYAGADNGWYDLNCMSSDEQVIPHRNTGDWQLDFARLYLRQWQPSDYIINNTWKWLYFSIFQANLAVELLENANADPSKIAEARVARAFFYYLLMDDFGNVPFFTENTLAADKIPQVSRSVVFDYIVKELTENVEKLSDEKGGAYYGRFNKWAGYALLAKVYLNAEVYNGTPKWGECLDVCNKIIKEGGFSLHSGAADASNPLGFKYFELFANKCPDDETIFAIYVEAEIVGRNIFTVRSFGGTDGSSILGYGAWNGTVVPKDYVEKFDNNDRRKRQFRFGANPYGPKPAGFINYNINISNLDNPGAAPNEGARSQKFFSVGPATGGGASNDFPVYRYADILLMKAECIIRNGGNAVDAAPLVTEVRVRAGLSALPANPTLDNIYDERGFELSWEGHRRQDMIRFGKFLEAHGLAPAADSRFLLFPIPTDALNKNSLLKQNGGYQ